MRIGQTETAELVRLAATGDDRAFTTLVSNFSGLVFALCLARTGNRSDAEDLAQDVFVTVHQRLGAIREAGKFPGWLRRITMNTCNAWMRKHRTRLRSDTPGAESPEPSAVPPASRAVNAAVTDALKSVSEKSRAVLTLHYAAGYSYQEIAGLLALPVATVKSRLREGRQQMRRELLKAVKELLRLRLSSEKLAAQVLARCGSKSCACARELLDA